MLKLLPGFFGAFIIQGVCAADFSSAGWASKYECTYYAGNDRMEKVTEDLDAKGWSLRDGNFYYSEYIKGVDGSDSYTLEKIISGVTGSYQLDKIFPGKYRSSRLHGACFPISKPVVSIKYECSYQSLSGRPVTVMEDVAGSGWEYKEDKGGYFTYFERTVQDRNDSDTYGLIKVISKTTGQYGIQKSYPGNSSKNHRLKGRCILEDSNTSPASDEPGYI